MLKKLSLGISLSIILSGCVANGSRPYTHITTTSPTCFTEKQCEAMWLEAHNAVQRATGMKLQIATSNLLQTYTPTRGNFLNSKVEKQPNADGSYTIKAVFWCTSPYACSTGLDNSAFNLFNTQVKSIGMKFGPTETDQKEHELEFTSTRPR